ncbi:MAG: hypothetical protein ACI857_003016 [Arenicella sp.]|jgi:hypothetical protein
MKVILIISALIIIAFSSCKKDLIFTQDHLDFSKDTVLFDTVFTTIGSTTKRLKIYNHNSQPINIEEVELMGGATSPFRINLDGVAADYHTEIEIPANDSLFVFVEVTLQVNSATNPLIIMDSIRFKTNGLNQYVNLDVWGQDAYFHNDEVVSGTWMNDKPHVLYNTVAVGFPGIDSNLNLTIQAGTQIYGHKNSQLIVYKSSLDIQGSYGNEVVFQGDRLESFYDDVSGQWWGIRLIEANTSTIDYAIIKNGSVGLQVDSTGSPLTLDLKNTIIDNHDFFAFNANAGPIIQASNCFFGDAGISSAYLFAGGDYTMIHCDFVNYWSGSRAGPALAISNNFEVDNVIYCRPMTADFQNNVADGTIDKEFIVDTIDCGVTMVFGKNFFKRDQVYDYTPYSDVIWTGAPGYVDPQDNDFHLLENSVYRNAGNTIFGFPFDLEGITRDSEPDLGCFEFN